MKNNTNKFDLEKIERKREIKKSLTKNIPLSQFLTEILQTSNSIETVLYEGIVGIMAQSSEEAMNHFSKDLSLFFSEFCHYFDFEVGLITNPQTPFYKELKKGNHQKFKQDYEKKQKTWLKNKEWKQKFENNLKNVWSFILTPENFQGNKGFITTYDGDERLWREQGAKLETYFFYKNREQNIFTSAPFSDRLYEIYEDLCRYPDSFTTTVENMLAQILDKNDSNTWIRIINNLYRRENFPREKTLFFSRKHEVENWGQDGWYKAIRLRGKKKKKWTEKDYNFGIFSKEAKLLAAISNQIGYFIEIYFPGRGFYEEEYREFYKDKNWCMAVANGIEGIVENNLSDEEYNISSEELDYPHITTLRLVGINLEQIPKEVFSLHFLQDIDLSNNKISSIPNDISHLRYLKYFSLYNNPIKIKYVKLIIPIDDRSKYLCQYLKKRAENEQLTIEKIESCIKNNQPLDFSSHIPKILIQNKDHILKFCQENTTDTAKYVEFFVKMEYIQGEPINPDEAPWIRMLFKELKQEIPIYRCIIEEFGEELFYEINQGIIIENGLVTQLFLNNLNIEKLPEAILHFKNIRELYLKNNSLTNLPIEMSALQNLEWIILSDNNFSDFPPVLGSFNKLNIECIENLEVQNEVSNDYFDDELSDYLKILYGIETWKFEEFCKNIEDNYCIRKIDALYPDIIKYKHQILEFLKKLKEKKEITKILSQIQLIFHQQEILQKIEQILGSHIPFLMNPYEKKGFYIKDFKITALNLESCNLSSVPEVIYDLEYLEDLDLSNNPIKEISFKILKLKKLRTLYLNETKIKSLPLCMIRKKCRLEFDDADFNSVDDDVWTHWFKDDFQEYLQKQYQDWSIQECIVRMKANEPITIIDKTHPNLMQMRPIIEDELLKIKTESAKTFLKYLRDVSEIELKNSEYSIFL
ncbi:MAG: hypothetical protein K9W44_10020 [Candidatus Lokiarchaeota archaeon]|nr:hypothetical protein [Candidatus Harpocratesius repetitus]